MSYRVTQLLRGSECITCAIQKLLPWYSWYLADHSSDASYDARSDSSVHNGAHSIKLHHEVHHVVASKDLDQSHPQESVSGQWCATAGRRTRNTAQEIHAEYRYPQGVIGYCNVHKH
jgi:hypothetical protein